MRLAALASMLVLLPLLHTAPAAADPAQASGNVVFDWNSVLLDAIRLDKTPPPKASRNMALTHVAIFDAVNGIVGGFESYHVTAAGPAAGSPEAAAAAAAHRVLTALYPAQQATFDSALQASLVVVPAGPAEDQGIAWGVEVADAILELRADDHSTDVVEPGFASGGGWWAPTPPAYAAALLPQWGKVTPWTMTRGSQFRGAAPPSPSSHEHAVAFAEVSRLGRADSSHRTPDQTEIALFWDDGAGTATPPGHWNEIATNLLATHQPAEGHFSQHSLVQYARMLALLDLAMADAAIVSWDHKYAYGCWRPVTGIQNADQDGNPHTTADPSWTSLLATPPFPAYTSGHSTFSSAAARVLALFFGSDDLAFEATSDKLPGVERSFTSLSQAAREAGQSRIYGGIHWQYDNQLGLASGRALADHVFFNYLRPTDDVAGPCVPGAGTLCLGDGRFRVTATWSTADDEGVAKAVALNDGSGSFWFFAEDNTELTVKIIDGCGYNERFWVFASGLTDVEVTLTVADTEEGRTRTYYNPRGSAFAPVQDVGAFATCN